MACPGGRGDFAAKVTCGEGKSLDNARHELSGHRRGQYPPQVGDVRGTAPWRGPAGAGRRVSGPHRSPVRNRLGAPGGAHAHAGLCGGGRRGAQARGRPDGAVERGPAMGRALAAGVGAHQWLRPPLTPGLRPLGGHDRRPPAHAGPRPGAAAGGGDGGHGRHGGGHRRAGAFSGWADIAGPRHHAARAGVRHGRSARAHGRGAVVPHQHQRCPHQRRHLCHCRCRRAHLPAPAAALWPGARVHDDGRCRLEDGPQHDAAVRAGGQPDF